MSEEANEAPEVQESAPESLLDESAPELTEGEWFQSDGVKGVGDTPDWYQSDHFKNVNEQARAYGELQKKFGSFTGAPKDGYTLPEGFDKDDALAAEYIELATSMGMNQEGFAKGFELLSAQTNVAQEISQEAELAKLGDNAGQRIKAVESALKFKAGDKYDELKDMITTADGVLLAESLIKAFSPKKLPIDGGENPTGITWRDIEVEMQRKDENGNWLRSIDRDHELKIQRMMKEYGGDKPNIQQFG